MVYQQFDNLKIQTSHFENRYIAILMKFYIVTHIGLPNHINC